jgi:hypothetical protein
MLTKIREWMKSPAENDSQQRPFGPGLSVSHWISLALPASSPYRLFRKQRLSDEATMAIYFYPLFLFTALRSVALRRAIYSDLCEPSSRILVIARKFASLPGRDALRQFVAL